MDQEGENDSINTLHQASDQQMIREEKETSKEKLITTKVVNDG